MRIERSFIEAGMKWKPTTKCPSCRKRGGFWVHLEHDWQYCTRCSWRFPLEQEHTLRFGRTDGKTPLASKVTE